MVFGLDRGGLRTALAGAFVLVVGLAHGALAQDVRRALIVSDIHFDPFAPGAGAARLARRDVAAWDRLLAPAREKGPSRYGRDTNPALLHSALAAVAVRAGEADLLVVPGDLIAHRFEQKAAALLRSGETSAPVRDFAVRTAHYVLEGLRKAARGRPVVVALGNNDSECGDYRLEPNGPFLAGLRETVRSMAGPALLASDFDETFAAAGYYRMRHPAAEGVDILVVNDVLWSADYQDRCGAGGDQAAAAMMIWLERTLDDLKASGRRAWLVHHIPVGIDGFSSLHGRGRSCRARVTPFLREPYASRFVDLVGRNGATIDVMLSGHIHHDTYRVIRSGGAVAAIDKVTPGISPIFGNNPGFQVLTHDAAGRPLDMATWSLPLDGPARRRPDWRLEYRFAQAYGQPSFSEAAVGRLSDDLLASTAATRTVRARFGRAYPVGHGAIDDADFRAHACAVSALDPASFAACACGD
ncbi:MAG: metallophosphoesterase [Alsobacter sp.]